jgi:hypothetical protein
MLSTLKEFSTKSVNRNDIVKLKAHKMFSIPLG